MTWPTLRHYLAGQTPSNGSSVRSNPKIPEWDYGYGTPDTEGEEVGEDVTDSHDAGDLVTGKDVTDSHDAGDLVTGEDEQDPESL